MGSGIFERVGVVVVEGSSVVEGKGVIEGIGEEVGVVDPDFLFRFVFFLPAVDVLRVISRHASSARTRSCRDAVSSSYLAFVAWSSISRCAILSDVDASATLGG